MPPKKRKAPSNQAHVAEPKSVASGSKGVATTTAATRSKRSSLVTPSEEPTSKKARTVASKGRGKNNAPVDVEQETATAPDPVKRRRGRTSTENDVVNKEDMDQPSEVEETVPNETKKRGRPAKKTTDAEEDVQPVTKKRGRPAREEKVEEIVEEETEQPVAKKRERPSRAALAEDSNAKSAQPASKRRSAAVKEVIAEESPAEIEAPASKKRGRPLKAKAVEESTADNEEPAPKKRRRGKTAAETKVESPETAPGAGRRGKSSKVAPEVDLEAAESTIVPKKRGRPAKAIDTADEPPPKRTARAKAADKAPKTTEKSFETKTKEKAPAPNAKAVESAVKFKAPAKTQTKKGGKGKANRTLSVTERDLDDSNEMNATEATTEIAPSISSSPSRNFWLMKAEPESRLETTESGKTVDVKFGIDDLYARTEPEPWDGIRNLQAQKHMRAMTPGDLAFFYESNCKVPGIVGIMEVVGAAVPDPSAKDKDSAYYNAKGNWDMVHVAFRRKFGEKVSLKELQSFGKQGGVLEGMQLLKQTRLSVSKVSEEEWKFIMSLVEDEDDEVPSASRLDTIDTPKSAIAKKKTKPASKKHTKAQVPTNAKAPAPPKSPTPTVTHADHKDTATADDNDDDREADFASAFEAPTTLLSSTPANHTNTNTRTIDTAAAVASAVGSGPEIRDVTGESVKSLDVASVVGSVQSPASHNGLTSTHDGRDETTFVTARSDDGEGDDGGRDGIGAALARPLSYA